MINDSTCPKCGSRKVIPRQKAISTSYESAGSLTIRLYEKLGTLKRRSHVHPIAAWVCGECGYTEWFVAKPKELYSVYQHVQQTQHSQGQMSEEDDNVSFDNKAFLIIASILGLLILISLIAMVVLSVLLR